MSFTSLTVESCSWHRLEAVASRFEDLEDTRGEARRQSTSTVRSFAEVQPAATPPPAPAPAIVVQQVTPPTVKAFDAIVIEARLKPLVELTAAFGAQVLIDQVRFSCSMHNHYILLMSSIGGSIRESASGVA